MVDLRTLNATWWQPKLGTFAELVTGLDDIDQCLRVILTTPPGTDPLRPRFALDLLAFIDKPIHQIRPKLVRGVLDAITIWEPRVKVLRVAVDQPDLSSLRVGVLWEPVAGGEARWTTVDTAALLAVPANQYVEPGYVEPGYVL